MGRELYGDGTKIADRPRRFEVDLTSVCVRSGAVLLPFHLQGVFEEGAIVAADAAGGADLGLRFEPPRQLSGLRAFFERHELRSNDRIGLVFTDDGLHVEAVKRERTSPPSRRERAATPTNGARTVRDGVASSAAASAGAAPARADASGSARPTATARVPDALRGGPIELRRAVPRPADGRDTRPARTDARDAVVPGTAPAAPRRPARWEPLDVTAPPGGWPNGPHAVQDGTEREAPRGRVLVREVRRQRPAGGTEAGGTEEVRRERPAGVTKPEGGRPVAAPVHAAASPAAADARPPASDAPRPAPRVVPFPATDAGYGWSPPRAGSPVAAGAGHRREPSWSAPAADPERSAYASPLADEDAAAQWSFDGPSAQRAHGPGRGLDLFGLRRRFGFGRGPDERRSPARAADGPPSTAESREVAEPIGVSVGIPRSAPARVRGTVPAGPLPFGGVSGAPGVRPPTPPRAQPSSSRRDATPPALEHPRRSPPPAAPPAKAAPGASHANAPSERAAAPLAHPRDARTREPTAAASTPAPSWQPSETLGPAPAARAPAHPAKGASPTPPAHPRTVDAAASRAQDDGPGRVPFPAPEAPSDASPSDDVRSVGAHLALPDTPAIVRSDVVAEALGMPGERVERALERLAEDRERVTRIRAGAYMVRRKQATED